MSKTREERASEIERVVNSALKKVAGGSNRVKATMLRQHLNSPVFQEVLLPLVANIREGLIAKGIKTRTEADWAAVEAADLIINAPHRALQAFEIVEEDGAAESQEDE